MSAQSFGRHAAQLLLQKAGEVRDRVGSGGCSNFEAYKSECGRAKGLEEAAGIIEQELRKYQNGENE